MNCQLPKVLVTIHHQTSSVCQSTTAVSGTILASLGRDSLLMAISVALLMNTMHFSMDNHHLTLSLHFSFLGRPHMTSIPLASVPLGMTTVSGMVSDIDPMQVAIAVISLRLYHVTRVYPLAGLVSILLAMWDSL